MGGKNSKVPSEAEQRRKLQYYMIQAGLTAAHKPIHFENLVFEGSGNKAVSYYGVLKVLEELGMLAPICRFAGVGAGAGWAMLLAIGLTPTEIADLNLDNELSYHAKFGMFALMPNLAQKLGWSPLGRAAKITQRVIEQRTGKPEITFKELLDMYGKELCIVATNLTTGSLEYFHPKTTPDVSIVDALVMSATLPGIMKPKYLLRGGQKHYFVDGGILCNYAIHAFDGWYLSMKKEDSFLSRLSGNLEPPFKGYNNKTLGIVTVSPGDGDFGEKEFLQRLQYEIVERPNTKLAKSKGPESENRYQRAIAQDQVQGAGQRLLQRLRNANISGESQMTAHDFQRALGEGTGSSGVDDIQLLFGKTREELTDIFEQLNVEREGKVTFDEFVEVAQQQSAGLRQLLEGSGSTRNIRNMPDIFRAVLSAVEGNSKRAYLKEIDIIRSIGVNTDYVGSLDPLGHNDKNLLVVQGEAACLAFLLDYTQRFAPEQTDMAIHSALPQRQISIRESIIDPNEMAEYTVPHNLYPTLPPSYTSAIGDSDYLRDTIETNWPQPTSGNDFDRGYSYEPEKQPLVENQLYPQIQPPQPQPPLTHFDSDPWGIPQSPQSTRRITSVSQLQLPQSNQQVSQSHQALVSTPVESVGSVRHQLPRFQVLPDADQGFHQRSQGLKQGHQQRPQECHNLIQQGDTAQFTISQAGSHQITQLLPQGNPHQGLSQHPQIHIQPVPSNSPQFTVSIRQPSAVPSQSQGGVAISTQLVTSSGYGDNHIAGSGSAPLRPVQLQQQPIIHQHKAVPQQQPQIVHHQQPVIQQVGVGQLKGIRFQQQPIKYQQWSAQQPPQIVLQPPVQQQSRGGQVTGRHFQQQPIVHQQQLLRVQPSQQVLIQSPVLQRHTQPLILATTQAVRSHGQRDPLVVQQPKHNQRRHQQQLKALQNEHGEISHFMVGS